MTDIERCHWLQQQVALLNEAGEHEQALVCLDQLIELEPDDGCSWHKRAYTHQMLNVPLKAIAEQQSD